MVKGTEPVKTHDTKGGTFFLPFTVIQNFSCDKKIPATSCGSLLSGVGSLRTLDCYRFRSWMYPYRCPCSGVTIVSSDARIRSFLVLLTAVIILSLHTGLVVLSAAIRLACYSTGFRKGTKRIAGASQHFKFQYDKNNRT